MQIISVSSHVAFGHVGNSSLVFPLQRLGVEVLPVVTTQLSNHLGYGQARGGMVPVGLVEPVLQGLLDLPGLGRVEGLISGFLGEPENTRALQQFLPAFKRAHPEAVYLLDPVMGDNGKLYVSPALVQGIRERLLPLADLATPNPSELGWLSGLPTGDEAEQLAAARHLVGQGLRAVLVTSVRRDERIGSLLVTAEGAQFLSTPRLSFAIEPNGAGDLIAALFLAEYLRAHDLTAAARLALARVLAVLRTTQAKGGRELALIAAQEALATADPATVRVEAC